LALISPLSGYPNHVFLLYAVSFLLRTIVRTVMASVVVLYIRKQRFDLGQVCLRHTRFHNPFHAYNFFDSTLSLKYEYDLTSKGESAAESLT